VFGEATNSAVIWVWIIEAASGIPFGTLVAVCREAAGIDNHACHMHQIPGHECGVAIGEIIFRPTRIGIKIRRSRSGLAEPSRIRLRRYDVTQVL